MTVLKLKLPVTKQSSPSSVQRTVKSTNVILPGELLNGTTYLHDTGDSGVPQTTEVLLSVSIYDSPRAHGEDLFVPGSLPKPEKRNYDRIDIRLLKECINEIFRERFYDIQKLLGSDSKVISDLASRMYSKGIIQNADEDISIRKILKWFTSQLQFRDTPEEIVKFCNAFLRTFIDCGGPLRNNILVVTRQIHEKTKEKLGVDDLFLHEEMQLV